MFLLFLLAFAAIGTRKPTTSAPQPPATGHRPLEDVQAFNVDQYTVLIGRDAEGTYDWRLWETSVYELGDDIDGQEVAQDFDAETLEEALAAAQVWVDAQRPPAVVGEPAVALAITRRGLRVAADCSRVSVTDIESWIQHAAAVVAEYDADSPLAEEVMVRALGTAFPECDFLAMQPSIRGATWEATRERVQSTIDKIVAGDLLSVQPVEEVVAARVVGMSAPAVEGGVAEWHVGENNGNKHAIVVVPKPSDAGWTWWVWIGPRKSWDDANQVGVAAKRGDATRAARAWADAYYNIGVG